jgi:hypothetical protein
MLPGDTKTTQKQGLSRRTLISWQRPSFEGASCERTTFSRKWPILVEDAGAFGAWIL